MKKLSFFLLIICVYPLAYGQDPQNIITPPGPNGACVACSDSHLVMNIPVSGEIIFNAGNTLTLFQPITISPNPFKLITGISAELVYFEFMPESEDCLPCNRNSATFGNFSTGVIASVPGTGTGTHSMSSTFLPPKNPGSFPSSFNITLPPMVSCCDGMVRWCIRYVISFDDCAVCSKVVCYQRQKTGTPRIILTETKTKN